MNYTSETKKVEDQSNVKLEPSEIADKTVSQLKHNDKDSSAKYQDSSDMVADILVEDLVDKVNIISNRNKAALSLPSNIDQISTVRSTTLLSIPQPEVRRT